MRKFLVLVLILAFGACVAYWQRGPLLSWHYFRQLATADAKDRQLWIDRLITLDGTIVPRAMACLTQAESASCSNGEAVLLGLGKKWGTSDDRADGLLREFSANWASFSWAGKAGALNVAWALVDDLGDKATSAARLKEAAAMLKLAAGEVQLQRASLKLAGALGSVDPGTIDRAILASLAAAGLRSKEADVRTLAVHLYLHAPLNQGTDLFAKISPLLHDSAGQVRRAALLVLGPKQDLLAVDELLPLLHDADPDVCRLCEVVLRSRGLGDQHILLARLISDDSPTIRLEVLQYLNDIPDLEPGVWLRRLCQDPSPAVRAAAVRAAAGQTRVDLSDNLRDLAQNDASATVRQIAGHYLRLCSAPLGR